MEGGFGFALQSAKRAHEQDHIPGPEADAIIARQAAKGLATRRAVRAGVQLLEAQEAGCRS